MINLNLAVSEKLVTQENYQEMSAKVPAECPMMTSSASAMLWPIKYLKRLV